MARSAYEVVYASLCPGCSGLIVKTKRVSESLHRVDWSHNGAGSLLPEAFLDTDHIEEAIQIHPISQRPTRPEIHLDGVPDAICADYRIALKVLDDPDVFPYANVLARRSMETALDKYRREGERIGLSTLVDRLHADQQNGLSKPLLENLDAIRKLGDMEAHRFFNSDGELVEVTQQQTSWNVSIWERFLQDWYVRPAEDAAFHADLDEQLSRLSNADNRPLKTPPE